MTDGPVALCLSPVCLPPPTDAPAAGCSLSFECLKSSAGTAEHLMEIITGLQITGFLWPLLIADRVLSVSL